LEILKTIIKKNREEIKEISELHIFGKWLDNK
jgi:hypothetical protein